MRSIKAPETETQHKKMPVPLHGRLRQTLRSFSISLMMLGVLAWAGPSQAQPVFDPATQGMASGFSGFHLKKNGSAKETYEALIDLQGASISVFDFSGKQATVPVASAKQVGQVFGIALDDRRSDDGSLAPNIYVTATSAYGLHLMSSNTLARVGAGGQNAKWMAGQWGEALGGGPGSVYKIDGETGQVSLFADLALDGLENGGAALGNIAFDPRSGQLFVSDRQTGMIFRLDLDGNVLGEFDHGAFGRPKASKSIAPYTGASPIGIHAPTFRTDKPETWGFAPKERRVWGLAVRNGRLYYAVAEGPTIWSVKITQGGELKDARLEFELPTDGAAFEVSDITFAKSGDMIVAQRAPASGKLDFISLTKGSGARVLRYKPARQSNDAGSRRWSDTPVEIPVGEKQPRRWSEGGIALSAVEDDGTGKCGGTLWSTGTNLRGHGGKIDGLQGTNLSGSNGSNGRLTAIDLDGEEPILGRQGHVGDVETAYDCGGGPTGHLADSRVVDGHIELEREIAGTPDLSTLEPLPPAVVVLPPNVPPITQVPQPNQQPAPQQTDKPDLKLTKSLAGGTCSVDPADNSHVCMFIFVIENVSASTFTGPINIDDDFVQGAELISNVHGPDFQCSGVGGAKFMCQSKGDITLAPGAKTFTGLWLKLPSSIASSSVTNCAGHDVVDANIANNRDCVEAHLDAAAPPGPAAPQTGINPADLVVEKSLLAGIPCSAGSDGRINCSFSFTVRNPTASDFSGDIVLSDEPQLPNASYWGTWQNASTDTARLDCALFGNVVYCYGRNLTLRAGESVSVAGNFSLPPKAAELSRFQNCVRFYDGVNTTNLAKETCIDVPLPQSAIPDAIAALKLTKTKANGDPCKVGRACRFKFEVQNTADTPFNGTFGFADFPILGAAGIGHAKITNLSAGLCINPPQLPLRTVACQMRYEIQPGAKLTFYADLEIDTPNLGDVRSGRNCAMIGPELLAGGAQHPGVDTIDPGLIQSHSCAPFDIETEQAAEPEQPEEHERLSWPVDIRDGFRVAKTCQKCLKGQRCWCTVNIDLTEEAYDRTGSIALTDLAGRYPSGDGSVDVSYDVASHEPWNCSNNPQNHQSYCRIENSDFNGQRSFSLRFSMPAEGRRGERPDGLLTNCATLFPFDHSRHGIFRVGEEPRACVSVAQETLPPPPPATVTRGDLSITKSCQACTVGQDCWCQLSVKLRKGTGVKSLLLTDNAYRQNSDGQIDLAVPVLGRTGQNSWSCSIGDPDSLLSCTSPFNRGETYELTTVIRAANVKEGRTVNCAAVNAQRIDGSWVVPRGAEPNACVEIVPTVVEELRVEQPPQVQCEDEHTWNRDLGRCVPNEGIRTQPQPLVSDSETEHRCDDGYRYDEKARRCRPDRQSSDKDAADDHDCPANQISDGKDGCIELSETDTPSPRPEPNARPKCAEGQSYDPDQRRCVSNCRRDQMWDSNRHRCVERIVCNGGRIINNDCVCAPGLIRFEKRPNQYQCIIDRPRITCAGGQVENGRCRCPSGMRLYTQGANRFVCRPICGENERLDSRRNVCVPTTATDEPDGGALPPSRNCSAGQTYDPDQRRCVYICGNPKVRVWNSRTRRCVCRRTGWVWDRGRRTCVPPQPPGPGGIITNPQPLTVISCDGGRVKNGTCACPDEMRRQRIGRNKYRCVSDPNKKCAIGKSYDPDKRRCVDICRAGQRWDVNRKRCIAVRPGIICTNGAIVANKCVCGKNSTRQQIGKREWRCERKSQGSVPKPGLKCIGGKVRGKLCYCGKGLFPRKIGKRVYRCEQQKKTKGSADGDTTGAKPKHPRIKCIGGKPAGKTCWCGAGKFPRKVGKNKYRCRPIKKKGGKGKPGNPRLTCIGGKPAGKICWCGFGKFPKKVGKNRYLCK